MNKLRTFGLALTVTCLVAGAGVAQATFQRTSAPAPNNAHYNVWHYNYGAWMAENPGGRPYGTSMPLYIEQYACAQVGQGSDPNCNNTWNSVLNLSVQVWRDGLNAYYGPNIDPIFVAAVPGISPCTNADHARALANSDQIAVCVGPTLALDSGQFEPNWNYTNGTWHLRGGVVRVGPVSTLQSFWNIITHELGHAFALGHRGGYGQFDNKSGNFGIVDPMPGSVMDNNTIYVYHYPDSEDFRWSVYLNGGFLPGAGGYDHCYNLHPDASCPGVNDIS